MTLTSSIAPLQCIYLSPFTKDIRGEVHLIVYRPIFKALLRNRAISIIILTAMLSQKVGSLFLFTDTNDDIFYLSRKILT